MNEIKCTTCNSHNVSIIKIEEKTILCKCFNCAEQSRPSIFYSYHTEQEEINRHLTDDK